MELIKTTTRGWWTPKCFFACLKSAQNYILQISSIRMFNWLNSRCFEYVELGLFYRDNCLDLWSVITAKINIWYFAIQTCSSVIQCWYFAIETCSSVIQFWYFAIQTCSSVIQFWYFAIPTVKPAVLWLRYVIIMMCILFWCFDMATCSSAWHSVTSFLHNNLFPAKMFIFNN